MRLDYKLETTAIQKQFKKLQSLGKADGLTRKIAGVLQKDAEDAFDNERAPTGETWQALNHDYKVQRYKRGYTGLMLQVTGDLVDSLNIDYGDNFAAVGVYEPHGKFHQLGTDRIPARPFLGLSPLGVEEITDIISKRIQEILSG